MKRRRQQDGATPPASLRDRLTGDRHAFTPSEMKVVRELVANYPAAGLATVSRLARRAGVSDPTVVRLANKLGFSGFPAFQEALLSEIEEQMNSPLTMLSARRDQLRSDVYRTFFSAAIASLEANLQEMLPTDFEAAVRLLCDGNRRVWCLGGRFSRHLAAILHLHLQQLRRDTVLLSGSESELADRLVDVQRKDVLLVYDYRRYQQDTVRFCRHAAERGAVIVLMTDRWMSPIAELARVVLKAPVETVSPFDTMVPALVQTEAIIAGVVARLTEDSRERLEALEGYRADFHITLDAAEPERRSRRRARHGDGAAARDHRHAT